MAHSDANSTWPVNPDESESNRVYDLRDSCSMALVDRRHLDRALRRRLMSLATDEISSLRQPGAGAGRRRGIERERKVRALLEADGYGYPPSLGDPAGLKEKWWVGRAAGSLGDADLIAMRFDRVPMLIEVKSTTTPFATFGPEDRAELLAAGELAGVDVWLAWWPKGARRGPRWIHPSSWPGAKA